MKSKQHAWWETNAHWIHNSSCCLVFIILNATAWFSCYYWLGFTISAYFIPIMSHPVGICTPLLSGVLLTYSNHTSANPGVLYCVFLVICFSKKKKKKEKKISRIRYVSMWVHEHDHFQNLAKSTKLVRAPKPNLGLYASAHPWKPSSSDSAARSSLVLKRVQWLFLPPTGELIFWFSWASSVTENKFSPITT